MAEGFLAFLSKIRLRLGCAVKYLLVCLLLVQGSEGYAKEFTAESRTVELQSQMAQGDAEEEDVNDPLEPLNRLIFRFNEFFQSIFLRPIASLYNDNLPALFRAGVSNFLGNITAPVTIANHLLQGDPEEALRSVGRFMVNTTLGIGGIVNAAADLGDPGRDEDFGQTLGVWGSGEGFYLVLPIFGPSSPRDAIGKFLVDTYFNPVGLWIDNTDQTRLYWSQKVVDGISEYSDVVDELDQMRKTSVDYYAVIRSLYRQKRNSEISNGELIEIPAIPELGYDFRPGKSGQPIAKAR